MLPLSRPRFLARTIKHEISSQCWQRWTTSGCHASSSSAHGGPGTRTTALRQHPQALMALDYFEVHHAMHIPVQRIRFGLAQTRNHDSFFTTEPFDKVLARRNMTICAAVVVALSASTVTHIFQQ